MLVFRHPQVKQRIKMHRIELVCDACLLHANLKYNSKNIIINYNLSIVLYSIMFIIKVNINTIM